jgi:hypothetical protein
MLFEEIRFHPAEPAERPVPLWQVRLVKPDAPGVAYDGTGVWYASDVLAALERGAHEKEARERPIETELVPLGEQKIVAKKANAAEVE